MRVHGSSFASSAVNPPTKEEVKGKDCVVRRGIALSVLMAVCWQMGFAQQSVSLEGRMQDWSPLAISVVPAVECPIEDWSVYGLRLNLFVGRHYDVGFLDVGGLGNLVTDEAYGLSVAGLYNQIQKSPGVLQTAGIASFCQDSLTGVQTSGIFSKTVNDLTGAQISPIALSGTLYGLQIGVFNHAEAMFGLQVGVVNYAHQVDGLQIGLLNLIADSACPMMPIMNVGF